MLPLPPPQAAFSSRHIGLNDADINAMLDSVGISSLTELLDTVIPKKYPAPEQNGVATGIIGT